MRKWIFALFPAIVLTFSPVMAYALDNDCPNRLITVINQSQYPVTEIYVSCSDCSNWSSNFLSGTLMPGYQITINGDYAPGSGNGYHVFDFLAKSPFGVTWEIRGDICLNDTWTLYND